MSLSLSDVSRPSPLAAHSPGKGLGCRVAFIICLRERQDGSLSPGVGPTERVEGLARAPSVEFPENWLGWPFLQESFLLSLSFRRSS